jgi:probable HAF family extracellular repeat protein
VQADCQTIFRGFDRWKNHPQKSVKIIGELIDQIGSASRIFLVFLLAASPLLPNLRGGYTVTDLGTFGGSSNVADAINDLGWVVGGADTPGDAAAHAFLYRNGKLRLGRWRC